MNDLGFGKVDLFCKFGELIELVGEWDLVGDLVIEKMIFFVLKCKLIIGFGNCLVKIGENCFFMLVLFKLFLGVL